MGGRRAPCPERRQTWPSELASLLRLLNSYFHATLKPLANLIKSNMQTWTHTRPLPNEVYFRVYIYSLNLSSTQTYKHVSKMVANAVMKCAETENAEQNRVSTYLQCISGYGLIPHFKDILSLNMSLGKCYCLLLSFLKAFYWTKHSCTCIYCHYKENKGTK